VLCESTTRGAGRGLEACARLAATSNVIVFHSSRSGRASPACARVSSPAIRLIHGTPADHYGGVAVPYRSWPASTAYGGRGSRRGGRQRYRANFDAAWRSWASNRFRAPGGGFFCGSTSAMARRGRRLWAEAGIAAAGAIWPTRRERVNPGQRYIRVALVYDAETTLRACANAAGSFCPTAAAARRLGAGHDARRRPAPA